MTRADHCALLICVACHERECVFDSVDVLFFHSIRAFGTFNVVGLNFVIDFQAVAADGSSWHLWRSPLEL